MGRIMAIDYGRKRVGIAVTDELRIIANGLQTVPVDEIFPFLDDYTRHENVDLFVVGEPRQMNNAPSEAHRFIDPFVKKLKKHFPNIRVARVDERFTSVMAQSTIREAGLKKKDRQNKGLIDQVSATIMLQSYMQSLQTKSAF